MVGCKSLVYRNLAPLPGTVVDYDDGVTANGTDGSVDSIAQLQSLRDRLTQSDRPVVVIHFHGGLVDRCDGLGIAVDLGPAYWNAGAYPIFPVYNVGASEASQKGLSGRVEAPVEDPRAQSILTRTLRARSELGWRVENGRGHAYWTQDQESATTLAEERFRYAGFVNAGLYRFGRMWSYMKWVIDRSLGIAPPDAVASLGAADTEGPKQPAPDIKKAGAPAALAIMKVVQEYVAARRAKNKATRVVLVGHSTGGIYIAKFIRAWQRDYAEDSTHFNVIMIAPAVRYDVFLKTLNLAGDRIDNLRIFTMKDSLERYTPEVNPLFSSLVYAPSLLYAVSGIFENIPDTPILGLQRFWCVSENDKSFKDYTVANGFGHYQHYGYQPDLETITETKTYLQTKFLYPFAFSPNDSLEVPVTFRTSAKFHGSFLDDPMTRDSVLQLVATASSWIPAGPDLDALHTLENCDPASSSEQLNPTAVSTPTPSR